MTTLKKSVTKVSYANIVSSSPVGVHRYRQFLVPLLLLIAEGQRGPIYSVISVAPPVIPACCAISNGMTKVDPSPRITSRVGARRYRQVGMA